MVCPLGAEHPLVQRIFAIPKAPGAILFVIAFVCFVCVGHASEAMIPRWFSAGGGDTYDKLGYAAILIGLIVAAFLYLLGGRLGGVRLGPVLRRHTGQPANANPGTDPVAVKKAVLGSLETLADMGIPRHLSPEGRKLMREKAMAPAPNRRE